jgi:alpha,alpha-trehalase
LPKGDDKDDDDAETVYGLGNRKNRLFNALMKEKGVVVYKATVEIIKVRSAHALCRVCDLHSLTRQANAGDEAYGSQDRRGVIVQELPAHPGHRRYTPHVATNANAFVFLGSVSSCTCHCRAVDIESLFSVVIDGVVSESLGLKGKPAPDIFTKCAEMLGVHPRESIMVEDATSGVEAGKAGDFGLVVGVDRYDLTSCTRLMRPACGSRRVTL